MSKQKLTYQNIFNYLKGLFSNKERYVLEKEAMKDPFEEEAFEGLTSLNAEEFETDIKSLQGKLNKRVTKKKSKVVYLPQLRIAASVLVLFGLGILLYNLFPIEKENQIVTNTEVFEEEHELFKQPVLTNTDTAKDSIETKIEGDVVFTENEEPIINKRKPVQSKLKKEAEVTVPIANKIIPEVDLEEEIVYSTPIAVDEKIKVKAKEKESKTDELATNLITIKGTVTDSFGLPLPGANVLVSHTNNGVQTDFDGKFTIKAPKNAKLIVSYMGFEQSQQVVANSMNFKLEADALALEDVVIVGYGTQKRSEVVRSVTNVKAEKIKRKSESKDINDALSGRAAGVQITTELVKAIPPQGNVEEFKNWVYNNLDKSIFEKDKNYQIKTLFTVSENGKLSDFKVLSDVPRAIKKELKKVVLSSEKWQVATLDNNNVTDTLQTTFYLKF